MNSTLLIVLAVVLLLFCVGPMLLMKRRHSGSTDDLKSNPSPKSDAAEQSGPPNV